MSVFTGMVTKENLKLRSQAFSGTDLDTNTDNPGIVFPIGIAVPNNYIPSVSSIVDHENGDTILAHSEYRLITSLNDETIYIKGRCFSIVVADAIMDTQSNCEELFGITYNTIKSQSYITKEEESPNCKEFYDLEDLVAKLDYEPEFIIIDEHLTKKEVVNKSYLTETSLFGYDDTPPYFGPSIKRTSVSISRPELERRIRKLRTDIKALYKSSGLPLDDYIQPLVEDDLKEYTYNELTLLLYELEDYISDCEAGIFE